MFNTIINLINVTVVALLLALTLFIYGSGKAAAAEGARISCQIGIPSIGRPKSMGSSFPVASSLITEP